MLVSEVLAVGHRRGQYVPALLATVKKYHEHRQRGRRRWGCSGPHGGFYFVLALPRTKVANLLVLRPGNSNLLVLPASWQVITRQRVIVGLSAEPDQLIKKTLPKPGHRKIARILVSFVCLFVGRTNLGSAALLTAS